MFFEFFFLVLFVVLSALFSAAETALTSLSTAKVRELVDAGVHGSRRLLQLKEKPRQVLTTVLVGNTIVNIASGALATSFMQRILMEHHISTGLAVFTAIATGITTFFVLVFGEITPKTLALKNNQTVALWLAPFIYLVMITIRPVVVGLNLLTGWIIRLFGGQTPELGSLLTEDEILSWINLGQEQGIIHADEARMIEQVFDFGDQVVRAIMTPLPDIVSVRHDQTIHEAIDVFVKAGHSRLPVTRHGYQSVVGILYARDVLKLKDAQRDLLSEQLMREAIFVPESKALDETLKIMKSNRMHMVLVVDEYGSTIGLVTLEDLIEEIVGEISDEHDWSGENDVTPLGIHQFRVLAKMNVQAFAEKFGIGLPETEDFDSVGGFLIHRCGHIPKRGDSFDLGSVHVKVTEASKHRVISLEVTVKVTDDADKH